MTRFFSSLVALLALSLTAAEPSLRDDANVRAVQKVLPSVVIVEAQFERHGKPVISRGTGSIIDSRGYILTNEHVISGATSVRVYFHDDTNDYPARLIVSSKHDDLALLRAQAPSRPLIPIAMGSSSDLREGETLLVVGNSLGMGIGVTKGILSRRHRKFELFTDPEVVVYNLLETDASINPGNSGGPLVNLDGEMVGVNTAVYTDAENVGYALPITESRGILTGMLNEQRFRDGVVLTSERGREGRVLRVMAVEKDGPAAGVFERGDIIEKVQGMPVSDTVDYAFALLGNEPGDMVSAQVQPSQGRPFRVKWTLAKPSPVEAERSGVVRASRLETSREFLARRLGAECEVSHLRIDVPKPYRVGMEVLKVAPKSMAERMGLKAGDLLLTFEKEEIVSGTQLENEVRSALRKAESKLQFEIARGGKVFITRPVR